MQHNYVCLDRRYATSEVVQGAQQLPYGPYSYWLDNTKYISARVYFLNFATDNPSDAAAINSLTAYAPYYFGLNDYLYVFIAPNIIRININPLILNGNILVNKITALALCITSSGSDRVIYPLELQNATYAAGFLTLTLAIPKDYPITKSLSTIWTVSQGKYQQDTIFIPLKKIKKIKLLDFLFYSWLTDIIPPTGARYTVLINEYASNAFHSPLGNYHFIFNTDQISNPRNDNILVTLAHLEGNIYPVNDTRTYVNDNIAEYQFDPPVDIKDTLTLTLGIMGQPLALNTGLKIARMTFYISMIDWNSSFQVWIQDCDLIRRVFNGFGPPYNSQIYVIINITELITTEPIADAAAIRYATAPNGFLLLIKTKYSDYGSVQPQDPPGYCSPFGYITSLLKKSGEEYPEYPERELAGNITKCTAVINLLNYRCELILE